MDQSFGFFTARAKLCLFHLSVMHFIHIHWDSAFRNQSIFSASECFNLPYRVSFQPPSSTKFFWSDLVNLGSIDIYLKFLLKIFFHGWLEIHWKILAGLCFLWYVGFFICIRKESTLLFSAFSKVFSFARLNFWSYMDEQPSQEDCGNILPSLSPLTHQLTFSNLQ